MTNTNDKEYLTPAEKEAETMTAATLRCDNGRFEVGIPWKHPDGPTVHNNRPMAERRLVSLERSLNKQPDVLSAYREAMQKNIDKGYVQEVPDSRVATDADDQWYLPHFAVVKEDRQTTKVRIVFDAAAPWKGSSLNDEMLTGPKLQTNLVHVLLRFCSEPIALAGDISEMFLQVNLRPEDCRYTRFLWRKSPDSKPSVFEFNRLVFGLKASPYLAGKVLKETARKFKSSAEGSVNVASIVDNSFYVDDMLHSFPDIQTATNARRGVTDVLKGGGFHIRKWLSNSAEVLDTIPEVDRAAEVVVNLRDQADSFLPTSKALGITWLAKEDEFAFRYPQPEPIDELTKRVVLRETASIFDPRGQLTPFTIRPRMMFQEACIRGHGWDDVLSADEQKRWKKWFSELPDLSAIRIDRCFKPKDAEDVKTTVHVFVDASDAAIAAVAYVSTIHSTGVKTTLAISKARLAPTKKVSIPKMELKAAVLGVQVSKEVSSALGIPMQDHVFWTDSMNVLYWVRSHSRRFTTDVGVKIGEIQTATSSHQWRHVPGKVNPADYPTRGMAAKDLADCATWWHGPQFLQQEESQWPALRIVVPEKLPNETKRSQITTHLAATEGAVRGRVRSS